jgi:NAD(P)-dependent dehydrogenase (short-subunit alcohol dehydrogenase family)
MRVLTVTPGAGLDEATCRPMSESPLVIGTRAASGLVAQLGGETCEVPAVALDSAWSAGPAIEEWRAATIEGPRASGVVVAVWPESPRPVALADQDLSQWVSAMEVPFALWFAALGAGAERCADGGQLVAVVDRTDPKDAAGWSAETAVADAVTVMSRSLAEIHRHRGVRVHLVTSPARLAGSPNGTMHELVGAVALLLSNRGRAITSTVLHLSGVPR